MRPGRLPCAKRMRWGGTGIGTVDGARLTFRYDAAGRLVEVIDANQGSTRYEVNPRGLLSSRTDAAGRVVQFGYDEAYRLASLTDENRETYRFQYDRRDLVSAQIGLDGHKRAYEYDVCGQGTIVRDGQIETRYERDVIGRLTAKHVAHERCEYRYDEAGRITSAELYTLAARGPSLKNRVSLKYDKRGEVVEEYTPTGWLAHTYDELGNRVSTTISGGRTIDWLHSGSEHAHQIRFDGAAVADIERDDLHREVLRTQSKLMSHFGYDAVGRRARQTAQHGTAGGELLAKQWHYACCRRRDQKRDQRYGATSYRYDPTGRIEQAAGRDCRRKCFAGMRRLTWCRAITRVATSSTTGSRYSRTSASSMTCMGGGSGSSMVVIPQPGGCENLY